MKNITDLSRDIKQAQAKLTQAVATAFAEAIRAACVQVLGPAKSTPHEKEAEVVWHLVLAASGKALSEYRWRKVKKHVGILTEMRLKTVDGSPAVEYKLDLPDGRRYHGKRKRDLVRKARQLGIIFVEA